MYYLILKQITIILSFFLIMFSSAALAQNKEQLRLLDEITLAPIANATFFYAGQRGISDESGIIRFELTEGEAMELSHVSYGKWQLSASGLLDAIKTGTIIRKSEMMNLQPVSVISYHTKYDESKVLELNYDDKLTHDGGALLSQDASISTIRKGGNYGFDPVLRGFKYDQLNIVINGGQSATAACPNRMDPPTSQMAPNMTDRIEVLKGPHALRFGAGFGGTINFIPEKLKFTNEKSIYGRASIGGETNGEILKSEGRIGFSSRWYDVSFFGAWSQGSDYTSGDGTTIPADFLRGSFGTQLGFLLSENQRLRVTATRNIAKDSDFPALPMDLRSDDTWMLNARHDINFQSGKLKSINTTLFGSWVDHVMDNRLKPINPRILNTKTEAKTYNYGGRTEGFFNFGKSSLFAGADLRIEGAEGIRMREFLTGPNAGKIFYDNAWQNGRIGKGGLFGEFHHKLNQYKLVVSARAELNTADVTDPTPEFLDVYNETSETQINPSLSAGVLRNYENNIAVGLWIGRAQRSGSLTERFINYFPVGQDPFELLGNPQIKPETNNQMDLTFQWKSQGTILNLDLFVAYLQDFITSVIDTSLTPRLPASPGVRQFQNLDEALKTGFEFSWSQKLVSGLQHRLSIAYTYGEDLTNNEPLPEIAPLDLRYSIRGSWLKNKLHPEVTVRHVLQQDRISQEFGETSTPSFTVMDIKLGYHFNKKWGIYAGVQNLLDVNYYEHLSRSVRNEAMTPIYNPGRNFFISMNMNLM
jgi:iron complex outermembrane recepter protein